MSQIGIVIAAHGRLGEAFVDSASMIMGELSSVATVNLDPDMNLEAMLEALDTALEQADSERGSLLLLDLFGGTPCNAAAMLMQTRTCMAVTGVNLPMLLEVAMQREAVSDLKQLAAIARTAGESGIVDVKQRLDAGSAAG